MIEIDKLPLGKKIILFDGVCNLCNDAIRYIIIHDRKDVFRFVALNSTLGIVILNHLRLDPQKNDSIILYDPKIAYYIKSDAVIEIGKELGGFAAVVALFQVLPLSVRDRIYSYVAANRYKWYGKKTECKIPSLNEIKRFL